MLTPLCLAVVDNWDLQLLELLKSELQQQHPLLLTARQLQPLVDLWKQVKS